MILNNQYIQENSIEYEMLIKDYMKPFMCVIFHLKDSKEYILDHSIGVEDKAETVLTKEEFISNLTMLQWRAQR